MVGFERGVAVVGAGAAGLAAAWRLAGAGVPTTVYEARDEVGGRLRTVELGGARVDTVAQLFGSYYTATLELAEATGASGLVVRSPGRDALWRGGRWHGLEYGSPASMLTTSALPAMLKLRLGGRYLGFLERHRAVLDPVDFAGVGAGDMDRESIAAWGERELGRDFVELMAYPSLASYYGSTPEETSAVLFHALARAGLSVRLWAVRGGVAELTSYVAAALASRGVVLETGGAVERVEVAADGVRIVRSGGETLHGAAVVAVPPGEVGRLVPLGDDAAAWLAGVRSRPTATLALLLDRPLPVDFFGLSFPRRERAGERIAAICVQERKGADLVPEGRGALVVYPAPSHAAVLAESDADGVVEFLMPALSEVLPAAAGSVVRVHVTRLPEGGTIFYPGYIRHLTRYREDWLDRRLALAGDYLVAPTVEGAVRSGLRAAERLLRIRSMA